MLAKLKSTAVGLAFFTKYIDAVTHSVQTVFLVAVPISFVAFLLSFLLPEVPLRRTVETVDVGEVQGAPQPRSSLQEIELALQRVSARENRAELYTHAGRAGRNRPAAALGVAALPIGRPTRLHGQRGGGPFEDRPRTDPARGRGSARRRAWSRSGAGAPNATCT